MRTSANQPSPVFAATAYQTPFQSELDFRPLSWIRESACEPLGLTAKK
jgi:hypothetical protein